jgi:mono/diheme cytochrome c family protein
MMRRWLRNRGFGAVLMAAVAVTWIGPAAHAAGSPEKGRYIFDAGGCLACHTDLKNKGAPLAGGPPLKTPFGTFYAPNITPDRTHGIGGWSDADFLRAMREGIAPDGRQLYPVFPYTSYTKATDEDLLDLKAYIFSLPASPTPSRPHDIGFPFSIRLTLLPWKWMNFMPGRFQPDPARDAAWNRGAYLVQALAHCGECHTSRNRLGGLDRDRWLAGAPMPTSDLVAPNLTPDRSGLADWSPGDIAFALETGSLPEGGSFGGEMNEVVVNSTSKLTAADRSAIATYLKGLPPLPSAAKKKQR